MDEVLCNAMEDTTKHIWEKLEHMFTEKLLLNKLFLKEEILNLQMEEGANMMEHLSTFNRCIETCREWMRLIRQRIR